MRFIPIQPLLILFITTVLLLPNTSKADNTNTNVPLVTQIEITKGDSTYLYHYIYNIDNEKNIETKYVKIADRWIRQHQIEWIYNNGLCSEQRMRTWAEDAGWNDYYIVTYHYTNRQKDTETHEVITADSQKINKLKSHFTYNGMGLLTKRKDMYWQDHQWKSSQEIIHSYDANQKPKRTDYFVYENSTSPYHQLLTYDYRTDGLLDQTTITQQQTDGTWLNIEKTNYYYNPNTDTKTSEIIKKWDTTYHMWKNHKNIRYQYNDIQKITTEIYQYWAGAFWKNDIRYNYLYNPKGKLIEKQTYLPIYEEYRMVSSVSYTDFLHDKASLIQSRYNFWGGNTHQLFSTFIPFQFNATMQVENASLIKISYTPFDNTGVVTNNFSKQFDVVSVYPNPSKGIFYFQTDGLRAYSWMITDLSGKIIQQKNNLNGSGMIDLGDYKEGIYLLQVFTPQGIKVQKLIKN